MAYRTGLALALCAMIGMSLAGCDDEGGSDEIVGTWIRTKNLVVGANTRSDKWTLAFNDDGSYEMLHQHTDSTESEPYYDIESRQGEYSLQDGGKLVLTGDWLDLTADIGALGDLDGNLYTYDQNTQLIYDEDRGSIFIGPDFNEGSTYDVAGDSYPILYNNGSNSYSRNVAMTLTDLEGNVVEERIETYEFTIVDDKDCQGTFQSSLTHGGTTHESGGDYTACKYFWEPEVIVQGVDGGTRYASAVRFEFTANGVDRIEYYLAIGEHLIGYPVGYQELAIAHAAFARADI